MPWILEPLNFSQFTFFNCIMLSPAAPISGGGGAGGGGAAGLPDGVGMGGGGGGILLATLTPEIFPYTSVSSLV